ncbi:scopoletin glucosyltransferase-like [Syzygium oleosum]|uniref:scopoletin glucosyltransferase-like n=1 Tax=Syzygium oleosum TaxID=219896 RepID=UPI0011D1A970|nr:scopoletin glucosyltransferase-like [Syzygium oleosum]
MSSSSPSPPPEILVVPFFGQGHLLPCTELCKHLAARNLKATLVISSNLSSSIPSSLRGHHPLLRIAEIPSSPPPPAEPGSDPMEAHRAHHAQLAQGLEDMLAPRPGDPSAARPACAVLDVMMGWSGEIFAKHRIPTVGFFTSGACSSAMEVAVWKAKVEDLKPGETRQLPGLPEDLALTASDFKRRPHGPPHLRGGGGGRGGRGPPNRGSGPPRPMGVPGPKFMGPPGPGQQPPWVEESGGWIAMLFHTCAELEGLFLGYLAGQVSKPVWGVGPLLPEQYWKLAGSLLHDREIRSNRPSTVTEDEVIQWLDSKPHGSVLYVAFGSEVGPTAEEYPELAAALEESTRPFIWAIQYGAGRRGPPKTFLGGSPGSDEDEDEGYFPHGLDKKVGERGLIVRGWAPQLLILSHPSTGGFLSHCGWNSTVEAIGRGVPFLTWPIRGDQYYNSKLVVDHLKIGHVVSEDMSKNFARDDIAKGIERLMSDEGARERAARIRAVFEHGFPASSVAALDALKDFIISKTAASS